MNWFGHFLKWLWLASNRKTSIILLNSDIFMVYLVRVDASSIIYISFYKMITFFSSSLTDPHYHRVFCSFCNGISLNCEWVALLYSHIVLYCEWIKFVWENNIFSSLRQHIHFLEAHHISLRFMCLTFNFSCWNLIK